MNYSPLRELGAFLLGLHWSELPTTYRSGGFSVLSQDYHLGSPKAQTEPFSYECWTLPWFISSGYFILYVYIIILAIKKRIGKLIIFHTPVIERGVFLAKLG
ncbi:MAG: hypothetical protein MRERV_4c035 [Mycoplasmataceae bacterium RV_VA103A]|nr:MAG: hypothetical protein MRERV_4c035 [Mycoplasmataceae bacterium RV_VA103A]